jgi:hypothetical protein
VVGFLCVRNKLAACWPPQPAKWNWRRGDPKPQPAKRHWRRGDSKPQPAKWNWRRGDPWCLSADLVRAASAGLEIGNVAGFFWPKSWPA